MTSKEFYKQLELVAEERGLSLEQLLDSFKKGLINAYKKTYGNTSVRVEFKPFLKESNNCSKDNPLSSATNSNCL